jgi:hypothetical protein
MVLSRGNLPKNRPLLWVASSRGSKTPQTDIDLIKLRLKTAWDDHVKRFGKESQR